MEVFLLLLLLFLFCFLFLSFLLLFFTEPRAKSISVIEV